MLSPVSDYVAYLIRERNVSYSPAEPCGAALNHAVVARGDWIATRPMGSRNLGFYRIEQVNGHFAITTNEVLRMPATISVPPQQLLERILTLEIVRVTERAAAARLRGQGNKLAADQAAVDAMRRELNKMPIDGTVVIGEGERDKAPMLFIGEKVGTNKGPNRGRSTGWHGSVRQGHAGSNCNDGDGRRWHLAERTRRLHAENRDRAGLR